MRIPLQGGLGNQLFQIAYGCKLMSSHNVRFIYFEEDDKSRVVFDTLREILKPELLERLSVEKSFLKRKLANFSLRLSATPQGNNLKTNLIKFMAVWAKQLFRIVSKGKEGLVQSKSITDIDIWIPTRENVMISGYFQNRECAIYIESWVTNYKEQESHIQELNKILVVQIRRGDYKSHKQFGTLSDQFFIQNIRKICINLKLEHVWIFSNDLELWENLENSYQQLQVIRKDSPGMRLSTVFELMRRGNSFLISNSTLGWWAAQLAFEKNPEVYYPNPWFKEINISEEFFPISWRPVKPLFND